MTWETSTKSESTRPADCTITGTESSTDISTSVSILSTSGTGTSACGTAGGCGVAMMTDQQIGQTAREMALMARIEECENQLCELVALLETVRSQHANMCTTLSRTFSLADAAINTARDFLSESIDGE